MKKKMDEELEKGKRSTNRGINRKNKKRTIEKQKKG